jgi:rod shape-determining protein MreC
MALRSRPRNTRLVVISLVMMSLLTITLDYRGGQSGPFEVAGRATVAVVGALQNGVSKVVRPIGAFFSGIAHVASLQSENNKLKQQVADLQRRTAERVSLERENQRLLALAHLEQTLQLRGVTATVVGESVGNFEWSITINRGSSSGVKVDTPVVTGDGLVGHVIEVTPTTSKVQLIIDPSSAVAARLSSSGETGLLTGQRGKDLTMNLISVGAKVFPNEPVVTSGYQGGLYPPDIPVGFVSHVYQAPNDLTKLISVRPAVDFSSLEFVLVVTGGSSG